MVQYKEINRVNRTKGEKEHRTISIVTEKAQCVSRTGEGEWSRAVIRLTSQKELRAEKALADVGEGAEKLLWLLKGGGVGGRGDRVGSDGARINIATEKQVIPTGTQKAKFAGLGDRLPMILTCGCLGWGL